MPSTLQLLLPVHYVQDAAEAIRKAETRVYLLSMVIADDHSTDEIVDALCTAAERGISVEVAADVFTYGELGGFFLPTKYRTKQSRRTTNMAKRFTKSGVKFTWLGRSHTTIFSGRTHTKLCIVDDIVYSFGGVNLYQLGIKNHDYMFKSHDHDLANKLIDEYHRLVRADAGDYAYPSRSIVHGSNQILVDGGFFGDSIIYRRACQLASEASRIALVSQYCPTGKLSKLINQKPAKLYFNPPERASGLSRLVINVGMLFSKNQTLYTRSSYLHAKFMIFYMADGRRVALTGSHNFVNAGVLLGTREIALQTENPLVIDQLEGFLADHVA